MGIFDWLKQKTGDSHQGPLFLLPDGGGLSPKEYGFSSVQWSIRNSQTFIHELIKLGKDRPGDSIYSRINAAPGFAHTSIVTLSVATYCTYAIHVLQIPQPVVREVLAGITDGLGRIQNDDGTNPTEARVLSLLNTVSAYVRAVRHDIQTVWSSTSPPDNQRTISFDCGQTATLTVEVLAMEYYGEPPSPSPDCVQKLGADEIILQHRIADYVLALIHAMRDELRLRFAP